MNRSGTVAAVACVVGVLSGGAGPRAQMTTTSSSMSGSIDPPVFRTSTVVVQIDASVTDATGAPIAGLTARDFEIIEGGRTRVHGRVAAERALVASRMVGGKMAARHREGRLRIRGGAPTRGAPTCAAPPSP